jgi:flagellin-like protein
LRKITKIKHSVKAISPVISVLLMIAIAVVASLVAYAWVMGFIGGKTTQAGQAIQIQSYGADGDGNLVIYVQNIGQGQVQFSESGSVYVNDMMKPLTNDPGKVDPGQTAQLNLDYQWTPGTQTKIKVVSNDGTFSQVTGSGTSAGTNPNPSQGQNPTLDHFSVTASTPQTAGEQFQLTVTAIDQFGNTYTSYTGTPTLTASPGSVTPSTTGAFTDGTWTGSVTLSQAGSIIITATDGTKTGTSNSITVNTQQLPVTYISSGSGAGSTNGNPTPSYPSGLQANALILLQITVRGDSTPTITPPSGFTLLRGPDASGGSGYSGDERVTQWIYYKFSTGSETGTGTVTISGTNYDRAARMYAFRNVALTDFVEGAGSRNGDDDVVLAQSVTTTGTNRLAVTFVSLNNNDIQNVVSFSGASGGTWTEAVSQYDFNGDDDMTMQLQTATMASAGTIQNGSYDTGNTDYRWVVTALALKPS